MNPLEFAILAFSSLFVVINPLSAAPIFLAMTRDDSTVERQRTARMASIVVASVLLLFSIGGSSILDVLGISIYAFQTAGGILLLLIALAMIQSKDPQQKISAEEKAAGTAKEDIAATPLAVPLLAGPGAISTSILLANRAESWLNVGILCIMILIVSIACYWTMSLASRGAKWINPIFLRVTTRLMGLLLAALAVQFVFNGLHASGLFPATVIAP